MLKLVRKLLTSAAAGIAMHSVSQAAPPVINETVQVDHDSEAKLIAEHEMAAVGVRAEYLAAYSGTKTELSEDLISRVRSSKRFYNPAIDATGAKERLNSFIAARTK